MKSFKEGLDFAWNSVSFLSGIAIIILGIFIVVSILMLITWLLFDYIPERFEK